MAIYSNPPSAFLEQYCSYGLIGVVGQNPQQPNFQLQFSSSTTESQKTFVTNQSKTFDWAPLIPGLQPNVMGFANSIQSDATIVQTAQLGLNAWIPWLSQFISQPQTVQAGWAMLIMEYQSTWLTLQVQTSVLTYAAQYNIPLTT